MTATAKADNILGIMSHIREKKVANRYNMVDIQFLSKFSNRYPTDLAMSLSLSPSYPLNASPYASITRQTTTFPIGVLLAVDVLRNPFTPTFPRAEVTPSTTHKRWWSLKFFAAIIALNRLAISLFPNIKVIKDVHIYSSLSAVYMLGYFRRCHGGIISGYKVFFFPSPFSTFHGLIITLLLKNFNSQRYPDAPEIKYEDVLVFNKGV